MSSAQQVLAVNDDLPIRTSLPVHSGKVRSVYWLTEADSARIIAERGYDLPANTPLAIMVISDRLSAFDCVWQAEGGLNGVPGKGAALNTIANHWFELFREHKLAASHILEVPHPLVWVVQKARPVKIEAIARQYITGSMWRAYSKGERRFCGERLPEGLTQNQLLPNLLITPSTKGILRGIPGVPEADDVNISRADLEANFAAFGFNSVADITTYETLLTQGFAVISEALAKIGQTFVDTKFEFGYVKDASGEEKMIYMDEVGTPDSSRLWDSEALHAGKIVENSKEFFRQALLNTVPDADVLLNKERMPEREALAANTRLPAEIFAQVSKTYTDMASAITGKPLQLSDNPRQEIIDILARDYDLIDD
ncbi:phosphoribosylaminoimidazolesuccinocarboxamide synthase [Halioxenophilus sp. WMMB6]|uniref:phosphoribosylaminoimidazolesuccinocarboxamide synthase n=1 Tax=Halioxenophilus sp. WMMB6 TaxID=3073815 RepID=UPI00295E755F|nr:phosphoribosylaminoimidazolesuccinocarboxamide synthase [Halioxenophilus sp. WMMB6]